MDAFTLKQHNETGELHLFKGTMTPGENKCSSAVWSECRKMKKVDSGGNQFACATEDEARLKIARIGRPVCGVCVSTLYTTYA